MTDYSLWEVIINGNKVLKRNVGETEQEYEPTTTEEKQDRRNEIKARGTLLMAGTDISQKDEKPSKKRQNRTRDGKVCEDKAQSKSSQLREEKAKKNIT
ncbi:hypothetical protein Tco_0669982 [Tanacetum coccineum]